MKQLLTTLRKAPASVIGILVALVMASTMATLVASLAGSAQQLKGPVHRVAAAPVIAVGDSHVRFVTGSGDSRETERLPPDTYRRLPVELADRLQRLPGVRAAVADVNIPLELEAGGAGGPTVDAVAHGWSSAVLTPFRLDEGRAPAGRREVVLGAGLARALHVGPGATLRLAGRDETPLTVVGVATAPANDAVGDATLFLTEPMARRLYGHPGQADAIAVLTGPHAPGTSVLASRVRAAAGPGVTVLTGHDRSAAEDVGFAVAKDGLGEFAGGAGVPLVVVALFVVAGAVALSVAGRRRQFALLRAVGATPGQIRRSLAGQLAVLGLAGGVIGYPVGILLTRFVLDGMADHQLVPRGTAAWTGLPVLLIGAAAGIAVAEISGFVAARRASRVDPVLALREATLERRRPGVVRTFLGLTALGGGVTLAAFTFRLAKNATDQLNLALMTLLVCITAVALLGPVLVSLAEFMLRLPLRRLGGAPARLALADIRRKPRRIASAVVSVALSIGFLGTVYLVNATAVHASRVQAEQRLRADAVVAAPAGLDPRATTVLTGAPGVTAAVGIAPTTVFLPVDSGMAVSAAGLTEGAVDQVLDLDVIAGRLDRIAPGDIAVSRLVAGEHKVGDVLDTYLADGTPYRARISAIYGKGLGFADALVPVSAAGGGHLGTNTLDQVLVRGRIGAAQLTAVADRFPGLEVRSPQVTNAQAARIDDQSTYLNGLLVLLIGLLAAVTLVNTLATATVERRAELALLDRIGVTRRELLAMAWWQAGVVAVIGLLCGIGSGAVALVAVTDALTGSWRPYVPVVPASGMLVSVAALTAAAIVWPTRRMLRAAPSGA